MSLTWILCTGAKYRENNLSYVIENDLFEYTGIPKFCQITCKINYASMSWLSYCLYFLITRGGLIVTCLTLDSRVKVQSSPEGVMDFYGH